MKKILLVFSTVALFFGFSSALAADPLNTFLNGGSVANGNSVSDPLPTFIGNGTVANGGTFKDPLPEFIGNGAVATGDPLANLFDTPVAAAPTPVVETIYPAPNNPPAIPAAGGNFIFSLLAAFAFSFFLFRKRWTVKNES